MQCYRTQFRRCDEMEINVLSFARIVAVAIIKRTAGEMSMHNICSIWPICEDVINILSLDKRFHTIDACVNEKKKHQRKLSMSMYGIQTDCTAVATSSVRCTQTIFQSAFVFDIKKNHTSISITMTTIRIIDFTKAFMFMVTISFVIKRVSTS